MSLRLERPLKAIRWSIDSEDMDLDSISSEEEMGSVFDDEQRARAKSVLEICDNDHIWSRLRALPQAEQIVSLMAKDSVEGVLKKNPATALLVATWLGKEDVVRKLLESGVSARAVDEGGRNALHLAVCVGNVACLKLLLQHAPGEIDAKDQVNKATPLHCAASKGHLACLRLLIQHGADVNAGLNKKSPLHYAVQSMASDCVKELLQNNATPNTPQVYSETPLHVAATMGSPEMVDLLLSHGAAVNVQSGADKLTPLHLAAEDGDSECARLLIEHGAQLSSLNHKSQTPLHLAALSQCSETLELLLGKGANPNARDKDGRTPLHSAIVKVSRSCECVRLLLKHGAHANQQDSFGYTPLHLAALNECSNCVMLLVDHGGDVTVRTNGGVSALSFITRKIPDVIPRYIAKFDAAIRVSDHEIGDVDYELKLDFRILVPTMGSKETKLLLNFIEVGHREILKHPLCETFLFLKWRKIRKFVLFSLFYHALFVLLYSFYIIGVYLKNCKSNCQHVTVSGYFLLCFNILFLSKEVFQICHNWLVYVKQWENWLQWLIIIGVFCTVQPALTTATWQHHVAAIGIFLAWLELMMIIGRFPIFGLYIQMFTTVAVNFVKFIAAYFCLLLAFALSFAVLFNNYRSFQHLEWLVLKILVMMTGELEFEEVFYKHLDVKYDGTAQIVFLAFVILVTVILANLMVGLAVSDIQGLQQSAGLDRLVRQAELVAHLESMLFSRLLKCVPHKLIRFFHKKALLLKSPYHCALYLRPNDPREGRIPKELIRSIYQLVAERREKPKGRKRRFNYGLYSPVPSRLSSVSSNWSPAVLRMELDDLSSECTGIFKQKLDLLTNQIFRNTK